MADEGQITEHDGNGNFTWFTETWLRGPVKEGDNSLDVAQRMYDLGLIWLANRTLHPFGFAMGVTVDEEGKVTALHLHYSADPLGINFDNNLENRGREKFYKALRGVFSRTLGG